MIRHLKSFSTELPNAVWGRAQFGTEWLFGWGYSTYQTHVSDCKRVRLQVLHGKRCAPQQGLASAKEDFERRVDFLELTEEQKFKPFGWVFENRQIEKLNFTDSLFWNLLFFFVSLPTKYIFKCHCKNGKQLKQVKICSVLWESYGHFLYLLLSLIILNIVGLGYYKESSTNLRSLAI